KDIPVVLGEFSASNYGNTEARVEWAKAYISQTKEMGIPCVLWDNNVEKNNGGEAHGYINRSNLTWYEGSETVVDTMMDVLKDDSIVWGSGRKSPTIEHDDIDSGLIVSDDTHELDASVKDGNCTPGLNATWKELENGDVAVQYTGDQPVIAVVDADWLNWTEIKAYDDKDGIAYYSAKHIAAAWGEDKVDEIAHLFVRTNSTTTVTKIAIIGEGKGEIEAPPEDKTKKYNVDFANRGDSNTLTFTIEGKAGSTTNGCVGYMGDEWTNIEWDGKIGDDGKLNVEVDISTIPASVTSAQIQIWWCDDENGEMTVYNFGAAQPAVTTTAPAVTTTTTEPAVTTTTTVITTTPGLTTTPNPAVTANMYGDANCDGRVTIADATTILQSLGNADEYTLSEQGAANADVNGETGISADDAVVIQKIDAKLLALADLPLKK
ncbi:MAG: endoglucanase, partial [Ruminococcus sp.]|nr:endoglucanase [Ruminococcus sp.]